MTPTSLLALAAATGAASAALAAPATAAPTKILDGQLAAGGTWSMTARHQSIGSLKGLCVEVVATLADGSSPGTAGGCVAGSLRATRGVWTLNARSAAGAAPTSSVVVGIVSSRARRVQVTFRDGQHLRVATKPGPSGWRRQLGTSVRYFGADALATTTSAVRSVSAYDRRGRRIGRTSQVH